MRRCICRTPLAEFLKGETVEGYYDVAKSWVQQLKICDNPPSTYSDLIPLLVWELRQFVPESAAIQFLLEKIIQKFKYTEMEGKGDKDAKEQYAVMLIFCRICSREPVAENMTGVSWYGALPSPHPQDEVGFAFLWFNNLTQLYVLFFRNAFSIDPFCGRLGTS